MKLSIPLLGFLYPLSGASASKIVRLIEGQPMSNVDQNAKRSEIEILQLEIVRLQSEQIAAELIATQGGMTPLDSEQYKMRHFRIRVLTKRLAMLRKKDDRPQFGEPLPQ